MKVLLHVCLLTSTVAFALGAQAQNETPSGPASFRLVAHYDRPGLLTPHWQIVVPVHGPVEYTGKPEKGNDPGQVLFKLSDTGHSKLADLMSRSRGMQPCETKAKGIANMGMKTVDYTPAGGTEAHCEYNFTDNKPLAEAFEYLLAIADTVQTGMELERLHRYDRLGLDPLMIRLVDDVKEGRAAELEAIRPTLESLVSDVAVMERVRTRAQQLLDVAAQQNKTQ